MSTSHSLRCAWRRDECPLIIHLGMLGNKKETDKFESFISLQMSSQLDLSLITLFSNVYNE